MLRVNAHSSAAAALKYYSEGLKKEDYYSQKQEVVGKWHGKAAQLLGLSGDVTPEAFAALVENRHPETGKRLTARTNRERIVGYDLNFHAPKSLSVIHALTGDTEILNAFRESVVETMSDIEGQIATRVRQKGAQQNRVTGNFAWAEFLHFTARPVGGIADPHLHVHCFTFNATHDAVEDRWKAGNFRDIKKDAPYSQALFHARLTSKLVALGFDIERTSRGWEVSGIPQSVIEKFSRRTAQIEKLAEARGITSAKAKDALGAKSREGKRHGVAYADLLAEWQHRLTPDERAAISKAHGRERSPPKERMTAAMAMDEAYEKVFARASVVETKRLIAEALHFGVGHLTPEDAWHEFGRRKMIVREIDGEVLCTSRAVLAEEIALINTVRSGRGRYAPLVGRNIALQNDALSAEQKAAVRLILRSPDQVVGMRGLAGVGKTTTMKEVVAQIEATGKKVFAFALSADASRGTLRDEGIANADTIAHLLHNPKLQAAMRGQVIWIDEAGLVGIRDMSKIIQIAGESSRVILTGDTGQHGPVARGDPFRLLQHYAGMRVAHVKHIRRQQVEEYREAVAAMSKGDLMTAFRRLEELDAVVEVHDAVERYRLLAEDYLSLTRGGKPPLVVSPTHAEGALVTNAIREAKRGAGQLGADNSYVRFHDLRWEEPDRRRAENYHQGLMVRFHQNATGVKRGESFRVLGRDSDGAVMIANSSRQRTLSMKDAGRFTVFEERWIEVAEGDRIRITRNSRSEDGRRLNNGDLFTIAGISRDGQIKLHNGAVLPREYGDFTHGYCQTSWTSQSKTMRDVLVAQSSDSMLASSQEQFYVSCSRGKETLRIYTDSRRELEAAVGISSARKMGLEFAGIKKSEVCELVNGDDAAVKWREKVRKNHAERESLSQVEKLLAARKSGVPYNPEKMSHEQFVAMKRSLIGPDGKSRSKGYGGDAPSKGVDPAQKRRSFLRPTEHTKTTKEKMAAAREHKKTEQAQAKLSPRRERIVKNLEAAKARLGALAQKVKGKVVAIRDKAFPKASPEKIAQRTEQQKLKAAKTQQKTQSKTKPRTPPPPVPRRVR